jgi:hypothetical protein
VEALERCQGEGDVLGRRRPPLNRAYGVPCEVTRVGWGLRFPHGLAYWSPGPSRRRFEPCVRFSRTRPSGILHREASATPVAHRSVQRVHAEALNQARLESLWPALW